MARGAMLRSETVTTEDAPSSGPVLRSHKTSFSLGGEKAGRCFMLVWPRGGYLLRYSASTPWNLSRSVLESHA